MWLTWGTVTVEHNGREFRDVLVAAMGELRTEGYWVRFHGVFDVTVRTTSGPEISGIGAKNYGDVIQKAITGYEMLMRIRSHNREAWAQKDTKAIPVLVGGRHG